MLRFSRTSDDAATVGQNLLYLLPIIMSFFDDVSRNVVVLFSNDDIAARFYQYGFITVETMYTWVRHVVVTSGDWALFEWDPDTCVQGQMLQCADQIVRAGTYKIIGLDGELHIRLTHEKSLPRVPTISNTENVELPTILCHTRDPYCLVTGEEVVPGYDRRFKASHIWPRAHVAEWNTRGFPCLVTDTAPLGDIGDPSKIDSIQNVLLFRTDMHFGFINYEFGINPDDGYKVVPFIKGYDSIAGSVLKLDHIQDPNERPIDELFRQHFFQGLLRHVKGAGEPSWDYESTFDEGAFDLSDDIWGTEQGRDYLEVALKERLFDRMSKP